MISVKEVDQIISANKIELGTEQVPFDQSLDRVLKENILADRDFPPFDRVMMDGIGIRFEDWANGQKSFKVIGLQAAGDPVAPLTGSDNCLEVMTGAMLPIGADTVVKYEELEIIAGKAIINSDHVIKAKQHVHKQATDRSQEDVLIQSGKVISPAEIAVLATVGKSMVEVAKLPKIAVVATGDELVEVNDEPAQHQIRKSNIYELKGGLEKIGLVPNLFHFIDDKEKLRIGLEAVVNDHDIVIMSGGVSKGKLDYVPEILEELGVVKLFHKVMQRPGKPFWFGRNEKTIVFALPGNPVSTYVGLMRYVIPFISSLAGIKSKQIRARLSEDFNFKPNLTYFLQVLLSYDDEGHLMATPSTGHGSGDLANLVDADAFLELPPGHGLYQSGEVFTCYPFR
jgi:molybdopterin molybdotransferase